MNNEKIEHESFAVLQISRISGKSGNLFGSSIQHQHFIELRICPADVQRNLNMDWIHSKSVPYITVQMSNTQFAEAITSMNMGCGVPVTLKEICFGKEYQKMSEPPTEDKRMQFDEEFEEDMKNLSVNIRNSKVMIKELCSTLSEKKQKEIQNVFDKMIQDIDSNIPSIKKQFTEQMDKTVLEAKGEVEGFFLNKVQSLGLKSLKLNDVLKIEK